MWLVVVVVVVVVQCTCFLFFVFNYYIWPICCNFSVCVYCLIIIIIIIIIIVLGFTPVSCVPAELRALYLVTYVTVTLNCYY